MVKLEARLFCYISVVLTEHMFENLYIFHSFKILNVTNFTMINEKVTPFYKNMVLSNDKINFYCSSKIQMLQLVIKVTHKK